MSLHLNPQQFRQAVEIMRAYLSAPKDDEGQTVVEIEADLNNRRVSVIDNELRPLLTNYLSGHVPLAEFKTKIDGINKRNALWGFRGTKGQMFFNIMVNVAEDENECDQELKVALNVPSNDEIASSRIKTLSSYVKRIGDRHVEAGGTKPSKPNVSSVPFFVSYFWQIQDRDIWPIYYTNSVNVMNDLNLWQPTGDLAADYLTYKFIHEELVRIFSKESGRNFSLYDVEHVFWFQGGKLPGSGNEKLATTVSGDKSSFDTGSMQRLEHAPELSNITRLPESYIPPVVAILPNIARNDPSIREAARASGTSLERALEKSIDAAFTILGYETQLLGQGKGRVPDGLALSIDHSYGILWDAKIRGDGYSMGTDDRAIREYIVTQSRDLKRRRGLRNIYYFIISSGFTDDYDDSIRSLKMETDVNEVCLVEADALVAMIDAKMRHPHDVSLGPDGLQRFYSVSGILSAELIREALV